MSIENIFHDRRRAPQATVPLTKQQRDLAAQAGLPVDERGNLILQPEHHRAGVDVADMLVEQADAPGVRKSANNLRDKVVKAVVAANPNACFSCNGKGCDKCRGTGRQLAT